MERLSIGPCPCCEKTIWVMDNGKLKMTDEGTHFYIRSNYNTVARFAICKDCLKTLNMEKVAEIVDRQVLTWIDDLFKEKEFKRYLFDKYRFYVALDWAKTEKEIMAKCRQASNSAT